MSGQPIAQPLPSSPPAATPTVTTSTRSELKPSEGTGNNQTGCEVQLTDQTNLLPRKKLIICLSALSLCNFVGMLDELITATTLSTISVAFNAGSIVSWVPAAYVLACTCVTTLYGRFSDIFGRKAMLSVALGLLIIGNITAGFSKSILQVILSRGVSGAGGGALLTLSQIIVSDIVSLRERGKYQGVSASATLVGAGVGPVIGGAIAQKAGWRWCFWFTIPLTLCAVTIVNLVLRLKPIRGNTREKLLIIDYLGLSLTLAACTLILLPLIWGGVTFSWRSSIVLGTLSGGIVMSILFVAWEWKGAKLPIVPMHIFRNSTVCGVCFASVVTGMITMCVTNYLPQFFQVALGYTPIHSGTLLIPVLATEIVANQVSGQIISRTGRYRNITLSGFIVWSISCGLISIITPRTRTGLLVFFMFLSGIGSGQTWQTVTVAAQASVPRQEMAVVTALRAFLRRLGGALGLAIAPAIINNTLRGSMRTLAMSEEKIHQVIDKPALLNGSPLAIGISQELAETILYDGYIRGFRRVFIFNASLAAAAFLTSALLIKETTLIRGDDEGQKQEARSFERKGKRRDEEKGEQRSCDVPREFSHSQGNTGRSEGRPSNREL